MDKLKKPLVFLKGQITIANLLLGRKKLDINDFIGKNPYLNPFNVEQMRRIILKYKICMEKDLKLSKPIQNYLFPKNDHLPDLNALPTSKKPKTPLWKEIKAVKNEQVKTMMEKMPLIIANWKADKLKKKLEKKSKFPF